MKNSITKSGWPGLLLCGIALFCSGCISRVSKASYPDSWSPVAAVPATPVAQCPRLTGRYANAGEAAPGTKPFFCGSHDKLRGTWCGDTALSHNLGDTTSGSWVELRQPDEDTLLIVSSDPTIAVQELHHKRGDFNCSGTGLERQLHVSAMSSGDNSNETSVGRDIFNSIVTAEGAVMYASGGVRTLTRRFSVAADGSLVMAVSQSQSGVLLLIPVHEHDETFVRWTPAPPPAGSTAPTPSVGAAVTPPADLPSAHVGIFEATNGKMWSQVKVTNLDGSPVNTEARLPGVPIAMEPGRHWVQVGAPTLHFFPLRDVDTKYAFEIEAVPGHRYRIPDKPPSCLAPGNIDAALASSSVYHARLPVIDKGPDSRERHIDFEALCVSASTHVCVPNEEDTHGSADSLNCVQPEGWSRGYYGREAGAVPAQ
jgi:hypothetical protein